MLYVSPVVDKQIGGGVVGELIRKTFMKCSDNYNELLIPNHSSVIKKTFNRCLGYASGMEGKHKEQIYQIIKEKNVNLVVFNTSFYGKVLKGIKKHFPNVIIITLFHNVEYMFMKTYLNRYKKPLTLFNLINVYINEKLSAYNSNILITFNKRDSIDLFKVYKKYADVVIPLCIEDKFSSRKITQFRDGDLLTGAFVGSSFFANLHGIKWFVKNVVPHIKSNIEIVGKGFEKYRDELEIPGKVKVIGTVNDVSEYYYKVDYIISPIFEGSGMKTKTAEAFMYGKTIFGSSEAFEGYNIDFDSVGGLCNTAEDYINKINNFKINKKRFNEYSRDYFINNHSEDVLYKLIGKTLKNIFL